MSHTFIAETIADLKEFFNHEVDDVLLVAKQEVVVFDVLDEFGVLGLEFLLL